MLLIDKPKGMTSYDVIRVLKKKYPGQKIGHAGTLDPNATGLLIVAVGKETKELTKLLKLDKEYDAVIELGVKTDTGDCDGKIIATAPVPKLTMDVVLGAAQALVGSYEHVVPIFSAIKQGGEPLYKKARRGDNVVAPRRVMKVFSATPVVLDTPCVTIRFSVASGTYIRSLAETFGEKLGTLATVRDLRRTQIGGFRVTEAQNIL